jgi:hypothetical protein
MATESKYVQRDGLDYATLYGINPGIAAEEFRIFELA